MTRALAVWWEGAVVGSLTVDRHGSMRFAYDGDWLGNAAAPALSVSLPERPEPFPPRQSRPFFEGLLPEGAQRDAVAAALGVSRANEFRLLEQLGGEVAGALSLWPAGETPPPSAGPGSPVALADDELATLLASLDTRPFLAGTRGLRLSLAGAQSKMPVVLVDGRIGFPAPGQPTTHILKPPIARFPATTENEAFAMRLAAGLGLDAAPVEPYVVADRPCLLVTRYDRRAEPDGAVRRLHQEDFCQALGVVADRKYAADGGPGFRQCFELVRRACSRPAVEVLKLLDAAIVQVLLGERGRTRQELQPAAQGRKRRARTPVRPAIDRGLSGPVPGIRHEGRAARHPPRAAARRLGPLREERRTRRALRSAAGPGTGRPRPCPGRRGRGRSGRPGVGRERAGRLRRAHHRPRPAPRADGLTAAYCCASSARAPRRMFSRP